MCDHLVGAINICCNRRGARCVVKERWTSYLNAFCRYLSFYAFNIGNQLKLPYERKAQTVLYTLYQNLWKCSNISNQDDDTWLFVCFPSLPLSTLPLPHWKLIGVTGLMTAMFTSFMSVISDWQSTNYLELFWVQFIKNSDVTCSVLKRHNASALSFN